MAKREEYNEHIHNPDGTSKGFGDLNRLSFSNDKPHNQREIDKDTQIEREIVSESTTPSFTANRPHRVRKPVLQVTNGVLIPGMIAAVVATVAVIAATVALAFSVNISLVFAGADSLTFYADVRGTEAETCLIAYLKDGEEIVGEDSLIDSGYLHFEDLFPEHRYTLIVMNSESEETLFSGNFTTAKYGSEAFSVEYTFEQENVFCCFLRFSPQSRGDFYSVLLESDSGEKLYVADDTAQEKTFSVNLPEKAEHLALILKRNGKTGYFQKITRYYEPSYPDYAAPSFVWVQNEQGGYDVTATFVDMNGYYPSEVLDCTVTSSVSEPTCTEDGSITYTATIDFMGVPYSEMQIDVLTTSGHVFGDPEFLWTEIADGYSVVALCTCMIDSSHQEEFPIELTVEKTDPTCTEVGSILYTASILLNDTPYSDFRVDPIEALGHDYGAPEFLWTEGSNDGYTAVARFTCQNDPEHFYELEADVESSMQEPTCTEAGCYIYYASVSTDTEEYGDEKVVEIPATGHHSEEVDFFGEFDSIDYETGHAEGTYACFICDICEEEVEYEPCEIVEFYFTSDGVVYILSCAGQTGEAMVSYSVGNYYYNLSNDMTYFVSSWDDPASEEGENDSPLSTFFGLPVYQEAIEPGGD